MTLTLKIIEKKSNNLVGTIEIGVGETFRVGRNPELCDLQRPQLKDRKVSQRHFEIKYDSDQVRLVDLGSTNGTFLDGKEYKGETAFISFDRLRNDVEFTAGDRYAFAIQVRQPKPADPITPPVNHLGNDDSILGTIIEEDSMYRPAPPQEKTEEAQTEPKIEVEDIRANIDQKQSTQEIKKRDPIVPKPQHSNPRDDGGMDIQINFDPDDLADDNW